MKKALIPALLVASAAFAPFLRNAVEFPERVSKVACAAARPLFWHLWYEFLNREIATGSQSAANIGASSVWQVELRSDLVVCIVFHVFLKHTVDGSRSVAERHETLLVSIPRGFIRRTTERQFSRVAQFPAI
jgi:hypothetical protein